MKRSLLPILLAAGALLLLAPGALADEIICEAGSGAGQCNAPKGVAVDREDELLYVADNGNKEVDVFKADGTFVQSFAVGVSLSDIAVDNDPTSAAQHDFYVLNSTNNDVRRFHPNGEFVLAIGAGLFAFQPKLALGPGGVVHVADHIGGGDRRVQKFDHEGTLVETCSPLAPGEFGENLMGFAVDSEGGFYLASAAGRPIERYDSSCTWLEEPFHTSFNIQALAVDADDNLFVSDATDVEGAAIYAYDPAATLFKVFYGDGTIQRRPESLAPHPSATGDVFAVEGTGFGGLGRVARVSYPPAGPVVHPNPKQTFADPIGNTKATLNTRINPEGKATSYHFQYVDDATYQKDVEELGPGHGFDNAKTSAAAELTPAAVPAFAPPLFGLAPASTQIGCTTPEDPPQPSCLTPETKYHFRAVATNPDGGPRLGPEKEFETKPPFEIIDWWASEVGADSARLHAQVNPLGIPASGHFDYVEEATYEETGFAEASSSAGLDFGTGEAPVTRTVQLHSLTPGTAYRYRLVVENAFRVEEREGAFRTFSLPAPAAPCANDAFRSGPGAALPDCRAYEMVSPVDKEGGEIALDASEAVNDVFQSAATVPAEGRGLTYSSNRAFGDAIAAPATSQYLASRHPVGHPEEGWSSHGISPPREGPPLSGIITALAPQYKAFSEDLAGAWLKTDADPPLTEDAIAGFPNLYRRENDSDGYQVLCPKEPPNAKPLEYSLTLPAISGDEEVVAIQANDKLTANASEQKGALQVYACKEGKLVLVSVLPGGEANPGYSSVGTLKFGFDHREDSSHHAVSGDGSRIYWTDMDANPGGPGKIYLRENPFAEGAECSGAGAPCTRAVSEAVGLPGASQKAIYWTASPDGATAIFSFDEGLLKGNLYRFDATAESEPTELIAEGVSGLAGWSEDASRLYLVSTKGLAPGAEPEEPNLYLYDASAGGSFELVAPLPSGGQVSNFFCEIDTRNTSRRCTRTTADGARLAFMSHDPLTGYDNTDATSPTHCGEPESRCDSEVFLYDSEANGGEGELRCISCNPTGGRPRGQGIPPKAAKPSWIAARIPRRFDAFYDPRALSTDGRRLFFESFDRLVVADTNGALDVYQWEEAGKGSCEASDAEFVESANGCITLISPGQDRQNSRFVDASADGSDVFFRTSESLWPEDPGLIDIYDARAGGGFPLPPQDPVPCEGEACQSPPEAPNDPTPASSAFEGAGNVVEPPAAKPGCPKGKRRVVRRGKAHCVKPKRKRHRRAANGNRGTGR